MRFGTGLRLDTLLTGLLLACTGSAPSAAVEVPVEIRTLVTLAHTYRDDGLYRLALERLSTAQAMARRDAQPETLAVVLSETADVRMLSGDAPAARQALDAALALAVPAGDPATLAHIHNNLGNLLLAEGRPEDAVAAYVQSLEHAGRAGETGLAARVRINLVRTHLARGAPEDAQGAWLAAVEAAERSADSPAKALDLLSLAQAGREIALGGTTDDLRRVPELLFESARIAEGSGDSSLTAYAYGELGALYRDERRLDDALRLTRRALFHAEAAPPGDTQPRWHWQLGQLHRLAGNTDAAIAAYRRAVDALGAVRGQLQHGRREGHGSYPEFVRLYFELAGLLLGNAPEGEARAEEQARLREARDLVERHKAAELEDYFGDDCVARLAALEIDVDDVAADTAIIYHIPLEDRLEILVTLPSGMHRATVPVTADKLARATSLFRRRIEGVLTRGYRAHAARLYDWLVRPVEPLLREAGTDTLVMVPHGSLRTVPIAALHDGEAFLIERFALAVTPGLTLTDPKSIRRDDIELLVAGLTVARDGFSPLPKVADELEGIGTVFGGQYLRDESFLVDQFAGSLEKKAFAIIHIASHGEFNRDPDRSFLLAYDGRINMNRLESLLRVSEFRTEPVELLTLSACQTAQGDERAALGLAGVAVKAGARSALATLWSVNDVAASETVVRFYRNLKDPSLSKAEALRRAQASLVDDPTLGHPVFWAPFLLIGNWL